MEGMMLEQRIRNVRAAAALQLFGVFFLVCTVVYLVLEHVYVDDWKKPLCHRHMAGGVCPWFSNTVAEYGSYQNMLFIGGALICFFGSSASFAKGGFAYEHAAHQGQRSFHQLINQYRQLLGPAGILLVGFVSLNYEVKGHSTYNPKDPNQCTDYYNSSSWILRTLPAANVELLRETSPMYLDCNGEEWKLSYLSHIVHYTGVAVILLSMLASIFEILCYELQTTRRPTWKNVYEVLWLVVGISTMIALVHTVRTGRFHEHPKVAYCTEMLFFTSYTMVVLEDALHAYFKPFQRVYTTQLQDDVESPTQDNISDTDADAGGKNTKYEFVYEQQFTEQTQLMNAVV